MSKSSSLKYPKETFRAECHRFDPNELVENPESELVRRKEGGWNDPSCQLLFKAIFPGFEDTGKDLCFELLTALILENTGVRDDILSAVHPAPVIKGFGVSDRAPQRDDGTILQQTFDAGFDRLLGGAGYMLLKGLWDRHQGVIDKTRHTINMTIRDQEITKGASLNTLFLRGKEALKAQKFPTERFENLPSLTTGVILSRFNIHFTAATVRFMVENARRVNRRYDHTPRLVLRFDYPESMFDDIGTHPRAGFFTAFRPDKKAEWETSHQPVPLEKVVYTRVERDGF